MHSPGDTRAPTTVSDQGVWCLLGEPLTTVQIARSGIGWISLDQQHGAFDDAATVAAIRALHALPDRPAIAVRVASRDPAGIGRALDIGADIVIVPMVETVAHAEAIVDAAHYPPRGTRSWGTLTGLWGATGHPDTPQVWALIETGTGLANAKDIARVDGVTALLTGPFDLAFSLSTTLEDLLHQSGEDAPLSHIAAAAIAAGKQAAAFAGTPERAHTLRDHGYQRIAITTDTELIARGAAHIIRAAAGPASPQSNP